MVKSASTTSKPRSAAKLAQAIARIADEKKARDIVLLDLRQLTSITDYFVICTGEVDQHVKAIADEIEKRLAPRDKPWHIEGYQHQSWILLDYVDVVVHIFQPETRQYYNLEKLWADAPRQTFPGASKP